MTARTLLATLRLYLHSLTLKRAWNLVKVAASFIISRATGRYVQWGNPFVLMIEPTNYCNLKCPLCPSGNGTMTRNRGMLRLEDFKVALDELGAYLFLTLFWNQGEPFLNRDLLAMVRYAADKGVPTLVSTNAHYIRDEEEAERVVASGLSELVVSLDGATRESYETYRVGGSFETVLRSARLVSEAKKRLGKPTPMLNLQFLVMKHNQKEMALFRKMAEELGADKYSYKKAQVYNDQEAEQWLPEDRRLTRYEDNGDLKMKGGRTNGCRHLWYTTVINWNGVVTPCCFDKDADFALGEAFNGRTIGDIWCGDSYVDFRKQLLADRARIEMCRNCSEGLKGGLYLKIDSTG